MECRPAIPEIPAFLTAPLSKSRKRKTETTKNTEIHENQRVEASEGESPRSPPSLFISCFSVPFVVPLSESGEQEANSLFLKFLPS